MKICHRWFAEKKNANLIPIITHSLAASVLALPRVQPRHSARGIPGHGLPGPGVRARLGVHDGVRHVQPGDGRLRAVQHQAALCQLGQLGGLQEERLGGKDKIDSHYSSTKIIEYITLLVLLRYLDTT